MTRTEQGKQDRLQERMQREAERQNRQLESLRRQEESNANVYGEGALGDLANERAARLYDIDTNNVDESFNKMGTDERIQNDGIDSLESPPDEEEEGANIEFNGSVLICINGSPYYIDIPYDSDTGPYPSADGANFPIEEPA